MDRGLGAAAPFPSLVGIETACVAGLGANRALRLVT
jgi:hypothetical protein